MKIHVFGIRHHGPGSARSLIQALENLKPDIVLVEGPPDAESVLPLLVHSDMRPPVALLIYAPDDPQQAVYYPFAIFSPEWQAIRYGLQQQIPVRFMDLPQTHRFALKEIQAKALEKTAEEIPPDLQHDDVKTSLCNSSGHSQNCSFKNSSGNSFDALPEHPSDRSDDTLLAYRSDPLSLLAQAAGYSDGERWWEHLVEQRQDSNELFAAILEAMTVLRTEIEPPSFTLEPLERQREAYMRKTIREAEKEGFQRIAVVCGAWHAPALVNMPVVKEDTALLKGLPKQKVEATWVPWTYGRLSMSSGYGAGIESPGWYQHLWQQGERQQKRQQQADQIKKSDIRKSNGSLSSFGNYSVDDAMESSIRWMTQVARLLRKQDLDASSASVIEAVRLAETLAALRDRPLPGLPELNEATQTVLCFGNPLPMQLVHDQLIVGERLGKVPNETPTVPLQQDLQRQQKRLRLKPEATESTLELDLRKPMDLERSHLLHRLTLLNIPWGKPQFTGNSKGTFRESWRLRWQPDFAIHLIEVGVWGNTIEAAATQWTGDRAETASLPDLSKLIDQALLANLPQAITHLITRLQSEAAIASDISHLMAALPPLINIIRYGTVRQFETATVTHVVDHLIARICVGLPVATVALDDNAAANLYQLLVAVHNAIGLLQQPDAIQVWQKVLAKMADQENLHGLLAGRCCRLLFEATIFSPEDTTRRLGLALSTTSEPAQAAAWIEGFLSGSGLLLLHNPTLWQVLHDWVMQLSNDTFIAILPLLRRTFSTFATSERQQMGERVRQGYAGRQTSVTTEALDSDRADAILPLLAQLLAVS